jgi:hypothetical protein
MAKWKEEDTKKYQRDKGDKPDSSKDIARAEHQARNDYQKDGGSLPNRDLSSKQDVPSKK